MSASKSVTTSLHKQLQLKLGTSEILRPLLSLLRAGGQIESDFSALCLDDKTRIRDVSECKYCINMKKT